MSGISYSDLKSQICEVAEGLFLSGATAATPDRLRYLGITMVINCTVARTHVNLEGVNCMRVPLEDSASARLDTYFDQCVDKIKETRAQGGKILVHCLAGISRSATICIAYLMKHGGMTLKAAFCHVKACRGYIRPNVGFFKQLIEYEERLYGTRTVSIVQSPVGDLPDVYAQDTKNMLCGLQLPDAK